MKEEDQDQTGKNTFKVLEDSRPRHGTSRDLIGIFLYPDFLPIRELALFDVQMPQFSLPIVTSRVGTQSRLGVLELLFHISHGRPTDLTGERPADELRSDF